MSADPSTTEAVAAAPSPASLDESPRRRRWWPLWLLIALLVIAGVGYAVWHSRSSQESATPAASKTSTATITRTNLT